MWLALAETCLPDAARTASVQFYADCPGISYEGQCLPCLLLHLWQLRLPFGTVWKYETYFNQDAFRQSYKLQRPLVGVSAGRLELDS
eukprot:365999-Chlamydomonas_euryale.AAC.10